MVSRVEQLESYPGTPSGIGNVSDFESSDLDIGGQFTVVRTSGETVLELTFDRVTSVGWVLAQCNDVLNAEKQMKLKLMKGDQSLKRLETKVSDLFDGCCAVVRPDTLHCRVCQV